MNYKRISIVLFTLSFIMILIGSTFAYWSWETTESKRTMVTFTVTDYLTCSADGGGDIVGTKIAPAPCTDPEYAIRRRIDAYTTSTEDRVINMDLWLEIDNISSGFLNSNNFKYALTTSAGSCYDGVINSGVFKTDISSNKVTLLNHEDEYIGTDSKTYWLWIWLDEEESDPSTMNQTFKAHLNGSCNDTGEIITKRYVNFGGSDSYFKATDYIDKITSISIVNEINVPSGTTSWNIGVSPSNASDVVGWLEDDGSGNDTYDLKIATSNGRLYGKNSFSHAFENLENVSLVNLDGLNTSYVTNMKNMLFKVGLNSTNFNINLGSQFYTSNVTDMNSMFYGVGANSIDFNLNIGNYFDTSKIINMESMFSLLGSNAINFDLNLGNHFNTSKVTKMRQMFLSVGQKSTNFNLKLGNQFNTSNVTNMASMFYGIGGKTSNFAFNLGSQFDTSNVTNMASMFSGIGRSDLNFSLNLGNFFDTSKVTSMESMFSSTGRNTTNFTLNLGKHFDTSNVTDMTQMFDNAGQNAIKFSLNLGESFNTSNVTSMAYMFTNAGDNATYFSLNLGEHFNTSKVTNVKFMFRNIGYNSQINFTLDLSAGNFSNVINNGNMFRSFPTSKATIYVKDAEAQQWIMAQNSGFNASNVLIKGNS